MTFEDIPPLILQVFWLSFIPVAVLVTLCQRNGVKSTSSSEKYILLYHRMSLVSRPHTVVHNCP